MTLDQGPESLTIRPPVTPVFKPRLYKKIIKPPARVDFFFLKPEKLEKFSGPKLDNFYLPGSYMITTQ